MVDDYRMWVTQSESTYLGGVPVEGVVHTSYNDVLPRPLKPDWLRAQLKTQLALFTAPETQRLGPVYNHRVGRHHILSTRYNCVHTGMFPTGDTSSGTLIAVCVSVCLCVCLSADISLYCAKNDSTDYPEIVWVCWVWRWHECIKFWLRTN